MRRYLIPVVVLGLLLALTSTALAVTEHCPGEPGGNENKIEVGVDPNEGDLTIDDTTVHYLIDGATVTFDTEVVFCVKAGAQASGELSGTTFTVNWLNDGGQTPDISYVVIYALVTEETPAPTPNETPSETPEQPPAETPEQPTGGGTPPSDTAMEAPSSLPLVPAAILIASLMALAALNLKAKDARK